MTPDILRRLAWLIAFRDGENTCEIARRYKVPEFMVYREISRRAGKIEDAVAECKLEIAR